MAACAAAVATPLTAAPASAAGPVVVSFTFDNQWSTQLTAAASLKAHGMAGTFYVIAGWVGLPGFLSQADLQQLVANGNEIGGKTVDNPPLPTLSEAEARREVCTGRNDLLALGLTDTDFAFPHAEFTARDKGIVRDCGYNSARSVGDLAGTARDDCRYPDCPWAESIPPADPYEIRTPSDAEVTTTVSSMQTQVNNARRTTGGWLVFSFHQICNAGTAGCDPVYSFSPAKFNQFLDWLQTQAANGVTVKTVSQVIGGTVKPAVVAPQAPAAAIGVNALPNPMITTADPNAPTKPQCWIMKSYGTNTPTFSWTPTGGQGGGGVATISMAGLSSGDAKMVTNFDLGECSPTVVTGHSYRFSAYYQSTVPVSFTIYGRTSTGVWSYWTNSPTFAPSGGWSQATWISPPVPSTVTAVSPGLTIGANGVLKTSNYSAVDIGGGPPPAAAVGVNALANPLLQVADGSGTNPQCWTAAGFGTNSATFSWSPTGGQTGGQSTVVMSSWTSGDAKLITPFDGGNCAPTVTAGHRYTLSVYYKSTVPVFLTLYSRSTTGTWGYWTQSATFPATSTWTLATWTSPTVPATINGASFGMTIAGVGTLSTSNYGLVDIGV